MPVRYETWLYNNGYAGFLCNYCKSICIGVSEQVKGVSYSLL